MNKKSMILFSLYLGLIIFNFGVTFFFFEIIGTITSNFSEDSTGLILDSTISALDNYDPMVLLVVSVTVLVFSHTTSFWSVHKIILLHISSKIEESKKV